MTASDQHEFWPPKGRRLLSAALVACPVIAIAGLVLGLLVGVSWILAGAMQVPFATSILYLMRVRPESNEGRQRDSA
jgi:hypothetical protein